MAWTNVTFTFGTKLEASKLNELQANFTALAEQQTNAPIMSGRAQKMVSFSADGSILKAVGISSITHGATGQYVLNMSATFSVGLQVHSTANTTKRSVPSTVLLGYNKNVAYSDVSVRTLNGANALRANSGTFQLRFNAMNASSQALEDVDMGHAIFIDNVE